MWYDVWKPFFSWFDHVDFCHLQVYENGTFEGETIFYFNLQMALRGVNNDKEMLMARVCINV